MELSFFCLCLIVAYIHLNDWFYQKTGQRLTYRNMFSFDLPLFIIEQGKSLFHLFRLNEDSLSRQPVFWMGTIIPVFIAAGFEYEILVQNNVVLTIGNIDEIFDHSKVPLYISAIAPTLGVFISNIHRTIQTKKQIETTERKNVADSYYAHHKHITDGFNNLALAEQANAKVKVLQENPFTILRPGSLYKKIFPLSNVRDGFSDEVSDAFINSVIKTIKQFNEKNERKEDDFLNMLVKREIKDIHKAIRIYNSSINDILDCLYASRKKSALIEAEYDDINKVKKMNMVSTLREIGWGIRRVYDFLICVLDVAGIKVTDYPKLKSEMQKLVSILNIVSSVNGKYQELQNK